MLPALVKRCWRQRQRCSVLHMAAAAKAAPSCFWQDHHQQELQQQQQLQQIRWSSSGQGVHAAAAGGEELQRTPVSGSALAKAAGLGSVGLGALGQGTALRWWRQHRWLSSSAAAKAATAAMEAASTAGVAPSPPLAAAGHGPAPTAATSIQPQSIAPQQPRKRRHPPQTHGFKGVQLEYTGKFRARVQAQIAKGLPSRLWHCGYFPTAREAALAHDTVQLGFGRGRNHMNFPEHAEQLEQAPLVQGLRQLLARGPSEEREVQELLSAHLGTQVNDKQAASSSRYIGVFKSYIDLDYTRYHLGQWDTEAASAWMYDRFAVLLLPDIAVSRGLLNFPGQTPPPLDPDLEAVFRQWLAARPHASVEEPMKAWHDALDARRKAATSSEHFGVTRHKDMEKWVAQIRGQGRNLNLGYYAAERDAARAHDVALLLLQEMGLRGARPTRLNRRNFPEDDYGAELGALRRKGVMRDTPPLKIAEAVRAVMQRHVESDPDEDGI